MRNKGRGIAAVVLTAAILAGCAAGDGKKENTAGDATASTFGTLKLQIDAEPATFDPQAAVDTTSFELIADMMEGLYENSPDGRPAQALADTVTVDESQTVYTITLKEAKWSNGAPVTAADFVYGWQRGVDPENQNENAFLMEIACIRNASAVRKGELPVEELGIVAVDERTLVITLEQPLPYFTSMLALPFFYPMNQEFYESCKGSYGSSPETTLGNGAFVLSAYTPAAMELEFQKNPSYREAKEVSLDSLSYQVIKDTQTAELAFQAGTIDMALLSGEQAERYADSPEFQSLPLGSLWYLSPNTEVPGLENENLRMALALSYDKELAVSQVLHDGSVAAYGAVPAGSMYGPDGADFRDGSRSYMTEGKERARELYEKAKKEVNREEFSFTLLIEDTQAAGNLGQFLQEEIQSNLPGVTIRLEPVPKKMRLMRMAQGDYELGLARWGADYADPLAFLGMWTTDSAYNYGGWSDETYDRLIQSVKEEPLSTEAEQRFAVLHEAEQIVMEQAAILPVCEKANAMLLRQDVQGAEFYSIGVNRVWKHVNVASNRYEEAARRIPNIRLITQK